MALAAAPGCGFNSNAAKPGADAGPGVDAPGGGGGDGGSDGGSVDTPPSGNGVCYGPSGWQLCLDAKASGQVQLQGAFVTDSSGQCLSTVPASWTSTQPNACIVAGDTVTVSSLNVTGNRPLILVAQTQITIMGLLDVASHRGSGAVGAGSATPGACKPSGDSPANGPPGGGGAGGSFMFPGGNGGTGDGTSKPGGQAATADVGAPTRLRGGCAGQPGGGGVKSDGGAGGGAVYLVSAGEISIAGTIDVSGAGGAGRDSLKGGGGGGSGGMIVLYGSKVTTAAATLLIANGGGGGGGSSAPDQSQQTAKGDDGHEPVLATPLVSALGGTGGTLPTAGLNGGDGGRGYPVPSDMLFELVGVSGDIGAGGGGGGGGGGYIRSNQNLGVATVSPAADAP